MEYEPVIGLEVHLQLKTKTKVFCGCSTEFGNRPNSQTCPVCLGLPGALPKLNREALRHGIKVALALNCEVQKEIKFDRKNYYYPDLPKNFQISQYDKPIAFDGFVTINTGDKPKKIRVKRVHLEEDAGKLIHDTGGPFSCVDYNRTGMPLLEIVTEPDLNSPQEAYDYLTNLKSVLKYLDVSDCDMEKGSLRCDANISVRPKGDDKLGSKVELKNMNSFKAVKGGLEYEVERQVGMAASGERIVQETRLWDADKEITTSMRSKEEAHDYRYFPEPDLVLFTESGLVEEIKKTIPILPEAMALKFRKSYALSDYDAAILTSEKEYAIYFEDCVKLYDKPKVIANWIMGDVMAQINEKGIGLRESGLAPDQLVSLLRMIDDGTISGKIAKSVLAEMIETKKSPQEIVKLKGLSQISDRGQIETTIRAVLQREEKSVNDYKLGKQNAFTFLVGQVMKEARGKANPALVNQILKELLGA